jgi:putative membrane protein
MDPPMTNIVVAEIYSKGSRKYCRTVYTHKEWVKHRLSNRFLRNLSSKIKSGIYKSLAKEVFATAGVATFLVIWNGFTGGYTNLDGVQHEAIIPTLPMLTLPLTLFILLLPSLGLLLVF